MSISLTWRGMPAADGVKALLSAVLRKLESSGKQLAEGLASKTKQHFQKRWPGSTHFSPSKVKLGISRGSTGEAVIDAAGITRAYHDIDIFPKSAKSLSIPIHKAAYGKSPRQLEGTFIVHKRDGSAFIAQSQGGSLAFLYVLKQHVHQRMDKTMMPSDDSLAEAALSRALQTLQDVPSGDTK